ncbi:hypothetical protein PBCVCVB1_408R [Paramecium bursaria Chlorella virus CVB-1]|nr:hypothetical protein PBCVCVB1_408R [Paramecium bursaria Chlorella virus CVB-1]
MGRDIQKQKEYQKIYQKEYYQRNKQKVLDRMKEYENPNPDNRRKYLNERQKKIDQQIRENAIQSLYIGLIINLSVWSTWFRKKACASKNIIYDMNDLDAFYLMVKRCFYCGEFATTLDRLDSNLTHNVENCVGCCSYCNTSKGAMDPMSFILQTVYRRTYLYYNDKDIWHDNKNKPSWGKAKRAVLAQNRTFDLSKEQYNKYLIGNCHYCKRHPPPGKFFGIDKLVPDDGYTIDNCVTACASCNWSKWDASVEEFTLRDERITQRYLGGYFDDMPSIPKNISHLKK